MTLTKELIFGKKLKVVKVSVPEWGGDVYVRELTAKEHDDINDAVRKGKSITNPDLAMMVICDENQKPLFTEKDRTQLELVSGNALIRILTASAKLSGADDGTIKELEKN